MKVLVTGNAGFIGSNLVEAFLEKNNLIVGIDRDKSRQYVLTKIENKIDMIWDDIKYLESYYEQLEAIDIIYHMAAASDIARSAKNPSYDLVENVQGTHKILEMMRKLDIEKLIFPSTSVVYGENAPRPTPETQGDFRPISQYAASKAAVENFIHAYANMYGINAWIFRFANVMGRNQRRGVVLDFVNKLNKNPKELEILGDGNQLKSYIHVSDCIDGMFWVVAKNKNKNVQTYNLAVKDQVTVKELADIVCDEMGLKPKYKFTGGDRGWPGDMPKISLAVDKVFSTGWRPKMDCEAAIRKTVRELNVSK